MRGECVDEGCKFEHLWVVRVCMCVRHIFSPFDLTNLHTINPISQYKNTNDIPRLEYPTYPYFHYNPVCAVYKSSRLAFKPHQFMFPTPTPYYWSQTHFLPNKKKKKKQIINQKLGHKRNRARGEKSSNRKWIENGVRKKSKKKNGARTLKQYNNQTENKKNQVSLKSSKHLQTKHKKNPVVWRMRANYVAESNLEKSRKSAS